MPPVARKPYTLLIRLIINGELLKLIMSYRLKHMCFQVILLKQSNLNTVIRRFHDSDIELVRQTHSCLTFGLYLPAYVKMMLFKFLLIHLVGALFSL